jgi:hypothetical protein
VSFLNSTPDDVAEKASTISANYQSRLSAIDKDTKLSDEGKRELITAAYDETERAMTQLRESFEAAEARTTEQLHRDLFGSAGVSGADAVCLRDAADRAAKYTTGREALAALQRADRDGDEVLARAIASHRTHKAEASSGPSAEKTGLPSFRSTRVAGQTSPRRSRRCLRGSKTHCAREWDGLRSSTSTARSIFRASVSNGRY